MQAPLAIVTGFGSFVTVTLNPSEKVAHILESEPPSNAEVRALELPVSFARAKPSLDAFLADLPRNPAVLLGLGVHKKGFFRLESRARRIMDSAKPDNDGQFAKDVPSLGEIELETSFDVEQFKPLLEHEDLAPPIVSHEAGGFVCERTYYALLEAGERLGIPALFLHIPPSHFLAPEQQAHCVRELVTQMVSAAE